MTKLPTFKGFTVDIKLKEFRNPEPDYSGNGQGLFEIIPFDSDKGDQLLSQYLNSLPKKKFLEIAKEIF